MKKDSPLVPKPTRRPKEGSEIEVNTSKTVLVKSSSDYKNVQVNFIIDDDTDDDSEDLSPKRDTMEEEQPATKDNLEGKLTIVNRVEEFYNRICTQTFRQMSKPGTQPELIDDTNSIQYGNLTNRYDPNSSIHAKTRFELASVVVSGGSGGRGDMTELTSSAVTMSDIDEQQQREDEQDTSMALELFRIIKESSKLNVRNLKLIHKSSLITLIERNRASHVYTPFDELSYERLICTRPILVSEHKHVQAEMSKIKLRAFNLTKTVDEMPNCLSSYCMPFFFDIFKPSELQQFTRATIDIITKVKSLHTPQIHLNESNILAFGVENLFWNCFALFKYKPRAECRNGFLNYLISTECLLEYFRRTDTDCFLRLSKMLPYFIDALILNGLFDRSDLAHINETFEETTNREPKNVDLSYYMEAMDSFRRAIGAHEPMRLNDLCRMRIKQWIEKFSFSAVNSLPIGERDKNFLLFQDELEECFSENSDSLQSK